MMLWSGVDNYFLDNTAHYGSDIASFPYAISYSVTDA